MSSSSPLKLAQICISGFGTRAGGESIGIVDQQTAHELASALGSDQYLNTHPQG